MIIPILACADIETSSRFYTENLEFTEAFRMPGESGPMFAMVSLTPSAFIGLSYQPNEPAGKGRGVVAMVYVPDDCDIDAYYERVRSKGTTITREIVDEFWGDRVFMVSDPDGFSIQLCKTIRSVPPEEINAASGS